MKGSAFWKRFEVGEDAEQRLAVAGQVGHEHVPREEKSDGAREKADEKQQTSGQFERSDEVRGQGRGRESRGT